MLSMKIEDLVSAIVRQELIGKGREDEALHFSFDISLSYYQDGKSYSKRCGLHLLYHVNPNGSYVNVFSRIDASPFTKVNAPQGEGVGEWVHECSHDSCWRNIRVFSTLYFDLAAQINQALIADGFTAVAPKDMSEHNNSPLFEALYTWVKVKLEKDPTDQYNYRKLVKLI
jgi:hypothetical protein